MKPIEVNLINYTDDAVNTLIYTKSTRLEQGRETRAKIENMSWDEKLKELEYMSNTIPSSWEFIDFTFEIKNVTRAFTHQFVRTRTGSYAQQTMRMLDKKEFTYRIPPRLKHPDKELELAVYKNAMASIQYSYDKMIAAGVEVEDARGILPTNIHTNIIAKFNMRTLAEMARSRTGLRTQDEYREVMDLMIQRSLEIYPWLDMFFFPVERSNFTKIESFITGQLENGSITKEEFYDLNKAMDKIRKGQS